MELKLKDLRCIFGVLWWWLDIGRHGSGVGKYGLANSGFLLKGRKKQGKCKKLLKRDLMSFRFIVSMSGFSKSNNYCDL